MPKHSGLLQRKGRFYLNVRVPKDLRSLYGQKDIIRKSLDTSDPREAISRVRFEAYKLDSKFEAKRRELKSVESPPTIRTITDREAHEMVFRWFIQLEKTSEDWWDREGSTFDESDTELALDNLRTDEVVYSGGNKDYRADEATVDLDVFLKSTGIECPKDSPAYQKLLPFFTKARLENVRRTIARVSHQTVTAREPLFREIFAHTEPPAGRKPVTVGEMVTRFLKALTDAKRSGGTLRTYEVPCRLLKEVLGEKTPVVSVTKEQVGHLFDLLRKAPSNATKRYRGLSLERAVAMADKNGDPLRLGAKTLENYYNTHRKGAYLKATDHVLDKHLACNVLYLRLS